VYFVSGLAGSAGALWFSTAFDVTVGASGAIFGLIGALLILEYLATGSLMGQAMVLILVNLALTFAVPGISIGGHLGGLAGGVAATYALLRFRMPPNRMLGFALAAGVGVASVVLAYVRVRGYGV
jgi:membrane associated rhomboid family serine protease